MDAATKAKLIETGGQVASDMLRAFLSKPQGTREPQNISQEKSEPIRSVPQTVNPPPSGRALPTSAETTEELKRRLAKELYRMELDLAAGLRIAGKPCDCGSNKHTLMLEAAAEELVSQDPANAGIYQEIINWIPANRSKITPDAIESGKYTNEYPYMANEFKNFRKRVMGSVAITDQPGEKLTLEEAKRMASEEAAREVERAWGEG